VARDDVIDGVQKGVLLGWCEGKVLSNPVAEVAGGFWRR
jgi:hypothetical protein